MNALLIRVLFIACLLMGRCCWAQQLQIVRPDGSVFESIPVGKFVVVELPDRFQSTKRYQGQLMQVGAETITMAIRSKSQDISITEIKALRRVSKFGAWARRSARIIIPLTIATAGNITGDLVKGGTQHRQILVPAAASIGAGAIAYLLLHIPPLKKAEKGYSFRAAN
jgi:hypothetical protein